MRRLTLGLSSTIHTTSVPSRGVQHRNAGAPPYRGWPRASRNIGTSAPQPGAQPVVPIRVDLFPAVRPPACQPFWGSKPLPQSISKFRRAGTSSPPTSGYGLSSADSPHSFGRTIWLAPPYPPQNSSASFCTPQDKRGGLPTDTCPTPLSSQRQRREGSPGK